MTSTNNLVPGDGAREYHLQTRAGDIAPRCIVTGDPARATAIADTYLERRALVGDHRGLVSYTGFYKNTRVSIVTHGMGGPSIGIILPEAVRSGARMFIRVGSCGALQPGIKPGDAIIYTGAMRYDGASDAWAPPEFPAIASWRVVKALVAATHLNGGTLRTHVGIGATTADFNEGQARAERPEDIPHWIRERHDWMLRNDILSYSMEEASLFVWCATHGRIPCGAVNAVFLNRVDGGAAAVTGELDAARLALEAAIDVPL